MKLQLPSRQAHRKDRQTGKQTPRKNMHSRQTDIKTKTDSRTTRQEEDATQVNINIAK